MTIRTRAATAALAAGLLVVAGGPATAEPFVQKQREGNATVVENWREGYLQVTAIGTADPRENVVQAEAMALEAARVLAQARLVELVQGVTVRSKALVQNVKLDQKTTATEAKGTLKHAVTVDQTVNWVGGSQYGGDKFPKAEVTLRLCTHANAPACRQHGSRAGLTQELRPQDGEQQDGEQQAADAPEAGDGDAARAGETGDQPADAGTDGQRVADEVLNASGVILRLPAAMSYTPNLSPVVVDRDGAVVYGPEQQTEKAYVEHGPLQYTRGVEHARQLDLLGDRPLVVDVVEVSSDNRLVIANEDAAAIRAAAGQSQVLAEGRVALAPQG